MSAVFWKRDPENWGEWERFDERQADLDPRMVAHGVTGGGTGERQSIHMFKSKSSPEVRFYFVGQGPGEQRHTAVYHAMCWAFANGYLPVRGPRDIAWICNDLGAREEVLAGGVPEGANGS